LEYQQIMSQQAIEAYVLRLCTQVLGWGVDVSKIFQAQCRKQIGDRNVHAYVKEQVYVFWGSSGYEALTNRLLGMPFMEGNLSGECWLV
jgi:hypothetical protein